MEEKGKDLFILQQKIETRSDHLSLNTYTVGFLNFLAIWLFFGAW